MSEKEVSNIEIVLFALYRLGGAEGTVDTEDVAVECWRLAPKKFSWKKYPQYPDSDTARVTLFDAAKPKYGRLVRGRNRRTGWMLTVAGIDRVRARLPALQALTSGSGELVTHHREIDRYLAPLEKSVAYKRFSGSKSCEAVQAHEFTEILRCSVDASPTVLRDRLEKLKSRAHEGGREDLLEFLSACEKHFSSMLGET
jgi:hypothetical protein